MGRIAGMTLCARFFLNGAGKYQQLFAHAMLLVPRERAVEAFGVTIAKSNCCMLLGDK